MCLHSSPHAITFFLTCIPPLANTFKHSVEFVFVVLTSEQCGIYIYIYTVVLTSEQCGIYIYCSTCTSEQCGIYIYCSTYV